MIGVLKACGLMILSLGGAAIGFAMVVATLAFGWWLV